MRCAHRGDVVFPSIHKITCRRARSFRQYTPDQAVQRIPLVKYLNRTLTARLASMPADDGAQCLPFSQIFDAFKFYEFGIATDGVGICLVQDIGFTSVHSSRT